MLKNSKFTKTFYLKAENGLFIKTDDGQSYDTLAGKFVGLEKREHLDAKGEKFNLWHLRFADKDEIYDVSMHVSNELLYLVLKLHACKERLKEQITIKSNGNGGLNIWDNLGNNIRFENIPLGNKLWKAKVIEDIAQKLNEICAR